MFTLHNRTLFFYFVVELFDNIKRQVYYKGLKESKKVVNVLYHLYVNKERERERS